MMEFIINIMGKPNSLATSTVAGAGRLFMEPKIPTKLNRIMHTIPITVAITKETNVVRGGAINPGRS